MRAALSLLNSRSAQPLGSISVIQTVLTIAGFRALIGELFPIISFPPLFSLSDSPKLLGTYIAPIVDGASICAKAREVSGERSD